MAYLFSNKLGRRGRKIINHPISTADMKFTDEFSEMYDNFSHNWQARARALRERKDAVLKYQ